MRKAFLLDSCLLVLLIVGLCNRKYIGRHKNLYPVYKERQFDILVELIKSATALVSTAHTLTETSNLLRQISDPMRSEIMDSFRQFVGQSRELTVDGVTASRAQIFIRLGLTDAAIVSLPADEIVILTVDHDLHLAASRAGFEVLNLTAYFHEAR